SYFDHPPLVGWVQWPLARLGGSEALLRILPESLWALSAWLLYHLTQRLFGRAGELAVALMALSPMLQVLGMALLPDTLLLPLTLGVMHITLNLCTPTALHRARYWVALG